LAQKGERSTCKGPFLTCTVENGAKVGVDVVGRAPHVRKLAVRWVGMQRERLCRDNNLRAGGVHRVGKGDEARIS